MRNGVSRGVCAALVLALALPLTSPLREVSRGSSLCPLDLGIAIERVFSRAGAANGCGSPTRSALDVDTRAPTAMAEHGALRDPEWRRCLVGSAAALPDTLASTAPPARFAPRAPTLAPRPTQKPCAPPPPVRGPPACQV